MATHLYETIQTFPAGIHIADVNIIPVTATGGVQSPYTFHTEAQNFGGQSWQMSLNFLPQERAAAGVLEAFMMSLNGTVGRFQMGDPYGSEPAGAGTGVPLVATAGIAGQQTIDLKGFIPNTPGQLLKGDYIQIGTAFYRVLARVDSAGGGTATATLFPNLREAYAVDTAVIIRNPVAIWRMTSATAAFTRSRLQLYGATLQAREAL